MWVISSVPSSEEGVAFISATVGQRRWAMAQTPSLKPRQPAVLLGEQSGNCHSKAQNRTERASVPRHSTRGTPARSRVMTKLQCGGDGLGGDASAVVSR